MKNVGGTRLCFVGYMVFLIIVAVSMLVLAIYSMVDEAVTKLRLWTQFDADFPNLLPTLVILSAALTLISVVPGFVASRKDNQMIVGVFVCLLLTSTVLWFSVGGWCASMQNLIITDMELEFKRIGDQAYDGSSDREFLRDLSIHMPRINNQLNYKCCEGNDDDTLFTCSQQCGANYEEFFRVIVFPCLYAVLFGSGFFCLMGVLFSCLYCCSLDHYNPAF